MLVTKEFAFDAAHKIKLPNGEWEEVHGHTWQLHVTIEGPLLDNGLVFDFCELDQIVKDRILSKLHHKNLNDQFEQPSAELVAVWVWDNLTDLPLKEVKVWEEPGCSVTYYGKKD